MGKEAALEQLLSLGDFFSGHFLDKKFKTSIMLLYLISLVHLNTIKTCSLDD